MPDRPAPTRLLIPALKPLYDSLRDLADLLFRLLVGLLFVPHGFGKLFTSTPGFLKFFGSLGLDPPWFFTYFIGSLEFFGGLAVALGLFTRPLAFMLFVDMAVATFLVDLPRGWFLPGGAEYVVALAVISLILAIRGGGRFSLERLLGVEV